MTSTAEQFGDAFGAERMWGLKELVFPDAVSVLPPAPGWYVLLAVVSIAALFGCWRGWQRWRRNAYRREALVLAREARPAQLPFVLRKAALLAFSRVDVASLRGADWIGWLNRTGGGHVLFEDEDAARLDTLAYGAEASFDENDIQRLRQATQAWLRHHVCI